MKEVVRNGFLENGSTPEGMLKEEKEWQGGKDQKMEISTVTKTKEWDKGRTLDHLMQLIDGEKVKGIGVMEKGQTAFPRAEREEHFSRAVGNNERVYAEK